MNFGLALEHLKTGGRVCRTGWNGKGMWLILVSPSHATVTPNPWYYNILHSNALVPFEPKPLPWIGMKTADNCFVPWLASQTDILAEDWELL
jgi:hypothetical protein